MEWQVLLFKLALPYISTLQITLIVSYCLQATLVFVYQKYFNRWQRLGYYIM